MTGLRQSIIFIVVLSVLMVNCTTFSGETISKNIPRRDSWYNSYYKNILNSIGSFKSVLNGKIQSVHDLILKANQRVEDFLLDKACSPMCKAFYLVYDITKGAEKAVSKVVPSVHRDQLITKNMHLPPKLTGHRTLSRKIQDKFAHLKGSLHDKWKIFHTYYYHLGFGVVGKFEDLVSGRLCHQHTKAKFPITMKMVCQLEKLVRENATRSKEYKLVNLAESTLQKIKKSDSEVLSSATTRIDETKNSISSLVPDFSLKDEGIASQITDAAKDLVPDIVKPRSVFNPLEKAAKSLSWNPIKKLTPSWFSYKKIPIPPLPDISLKGVTSYTTNPIKGIFNKIKNPISSLPDQFKYNTFKGLFKSQFHLQDISFKCIKSNFTNPFKNLFNTITSFFHLPDLKGIFNKIKKTIHLDLYSNFKGIMSFITNPVRGLHQKIKSEISGLKTRIRSSFKKTLGFFVPSFLKKWVKSGTFGVGLTCFALGAVAVLLVKLLYGCVEYLEGEWLLFMETQTDDTVARKSITDGVLEESPNPNSPNVIDIKYNRGDDSQDPQPPDDEDEESPPPLPPPPKETKSTWSQTDVKNVQETAVQTSQETVQDSKTQTEKSSSRHESIQTEDGKAPVRRRSSSARDNSIHPPIITPNI